MSADIVLNGNTLELKGNVVNKDAQTEILVGGPLGGYAFQDRSNAAARYVLYASNGMVRVWKDGLGDVFTIADDPKNRTSQVGQLLADKVNAESVTTKGLVIPYKIDDPNKPIVIGSDQNKITMQMDVLKVIQELQRKIASLEARLAKTDSPTPPPPPDKPIVIKR